jgi:hypothetical protein
MKAGAKKEETRRREQHESCLNMDLFRAELAKEKEDYAFVAATKQMIIKAMGV